MKKVFHILLIALTCCEGCKKDDPKPLTELEKLPAATQSGKNTFGCLINGKAFVPLNSSDIIAIYQQGILQLSGATHNPEKALGITINEINIGLIKEAKYSLNDSPNSSGGIAYLPTGANSFCDTNALNGFINITKTDRINYIISGTFEFTSFASGCDTMKITNGRFDQRYIP